MLEEIQTRQESQNQKNQALLDQIEELRNEKQELKLEIGKNLEPKIKDQEEELAELRKQLQTANCCTSSTGSCKHQELLLKMTLQKKKDQEEDLELLKMKLAASNQEKSHELK